MFQELRDNIKLFGVYWSTPANSIRWWWSILLIGLGRRSILRWRRVSRRGLEWWRSTMTSISLERLCSDALKLESRSIQSVCSLIALSSGFLVCALLLLKQVPTLLQRLLQLHSRVLDAIMLGHVGEDVVKQHVADEVAVVDVDVGQSWNAGLTTTSLVHMAQRLRDTNLSSREGVSLHHIGEGATAPHIPARHVQSIIDVL